MEKRRMLKEHFEDELRVNGRKDSRKVLFDLGVMKLTGEWEETPYGYCKVYYRLNRLNPLTYLFLLLMFAVSIFRYGIGEFIVEVKELWNESERLEVRYEILERNA